jgi:hypothetical protein
MFTLILQGNALAATSEQATFYMVTVRRPQENVLCVCEKTVGDNTLWTKGPLVETR